MKYDAQCDNYRCACMMRSHFFLELNNNGVINVNSSLETTKDPMMTIKSEAIGRNVYLTMILFFFVLLFSGVNNGITIGLIRL